MLVPLNWLTDYVPLTAAPAAWIDRLTLAGLESPGSRALGVPAPAGVRVKADDRTPVWDRDKVVVATVLKIEKHPDADKLKLVTVDYGAAEPKTVVTGAPNIAPGQSGMKVVLGLRGTQYYYNDKDGKKAVFTLEPKALRGVMNDAMCMSNFELGIADDHDGIIILDDNDPAPGTPAQDLLGDLVVELDVLPNMARCLSLLGVAREVAALTGAAVKEPKPTYPTAAESVQGKVTVGIADPALSRRYAATLVRNCAVGPAPRRVRTRLQNAGMRPINNVVDATNYVMLEYGQPLHAFDYDVLVTRAGGTVPHIEVRPAKPGEVLVTLDGQERKLAPENLVIADAAGAIALAGVMGGRDTEVTAATKTILLESAHFDPVSVRKTARQFNLFSEASTRFSKGVDAELVPAAAARAAEFLHKWAGGEVLAGTVDHYPAPRAVEPIALNRTEIERVLGVALPDGEIERVLTALQFTLDSTPWGWSVTPPANRLDIQVGAADLIEDLARVSGYDRLPGRLSAADLPPPAGNTDLAFDTAVQDALVAAGLQECITYSLTGTAAEAKLGGTPGPFVKVVNAMSPEREVLRRSLIPGLMEVVKRTLDAQPTAAVFELGKVYWPRGNEPLPAEPRVLAVALAGRRSLAAWDDAQGVPAAGFDFFDLKGVLQELFAALSLPGVEYRHAKHVPHLHPGKAAEVVIDGKPAGTFGELHPTAAIQFDLAEKCILVAELDIDLMQTLVPARVPYRPFSTFPPAKRDLAVVVLTETPASAVLAEIRAAGEGLLTAADLFDVYTGDRVPAGTKSLAFALSYQAADRTLGDKEIERLHGRIEGRLRDVLMAQVRGKDLV